MAFWFYNLLNHIDQKVTFDLLEFIDIRDLLPFDVCVPSCTMDNVEGLEYYQENIYKKAVRDFIHNEWHYIRDLHIIMKVFREEIMKVVQDNNELEMLFSNITDIYKITLTLLDSLKDNYELMEIAETEQVSIIGSCFETLLKTTNFEVYIKYARGINSLVNQKLLTVLFLRLEFKVFSQTGYSMEAVKCYLPDLLLQPIRQCFMYFKYIKVLCTHTPNMEDGETLRQVQDLLKPLLMKLMNMFDMKFLINVSLEKSKKLFLQCRKGIFVPTRQIIYVIQQDVDGWDYKDIGQCCYGEFIREDTLKKVANNGQELTDRKVFLFDEFLILCKINKKCNRHFDYQLEKKFFIRKIVVIDRKETKKLINAFEIVSREHPNVILIAESVEDKNNWMADLMMLKSRSMLESTLDILLLEEEKKYPLRLPPAHLYKFVEQDNMANIILEARENGVPLIKGGTLVKLIERMTHHTYADPTSVKTFLITYRSFCSPQELLTLLIERFDIPDPSLFYGKEEISVCKTTEREDRKRFKIEFCHPVQFRVLNVLRHWIDYHFYDFERDGKLLETLQSFLKTVNVQKSVQKWVNLLLKTVERKRESSKPITLHFKEHAPPIESHLKIPENNEDYGILTIHPVEFAKRLTLLDFELYSAVKSFELVGCVWTKEDKNKSSPNLMKIIRHTTNFTRWLQKIIVETQNFEERVAIVSRAIEIVETLWDLHNFNGILAIVGALDSAPVFRLKFTFQELSKELRKVLDEARWINNTYVREYKKMLYDVNPPCIPFLGMYLTNILYIDEGNPDYLLENPDLINFNKWRKVAEIIGEIQLYQNEPYCLSAESKIRQYIENMCPFNPDMSNENIDTYLYNESLKIEPRGCEEPIQFPCKWSEINMKSSNSTYCDICCLCIARPFYYNENYSSLETSPAFKLLETSPQTSQLTNVANTSDHNIPSLLKSSEILSPGSSSPSSYESSSKMSTPPDNILSTQFSTSLSTRRRKSASLLDESLQQDEHLHLQEDDVASSIQPVSTDSSDIKELLIKISSEMGKMSSEKGKMSSEMGKMSSEIDTIKNNSTM